MCLLCIVDVYGHYGVLCAYLAGGWGWCYAGTNECEQLGGDLGDCGDIGHTVVYTGVEVMV